MRNPVSTTLLRPMALGFGLGCYLLWAGLSWFQERVRIAQERAEQCSHIPYEVGEKSRCLIVRGIAND